MKFDKLCNLVLKEAYKTGETFIVINDDAINVVNKIPDDSIEKIANNIQVKLPVDKKFIRQIIAAFQEELPTREQINREDPGTLYSREDIMNKLSRKVAIKFDASKSKAFYFAKKMFTLLVNYEILKAVKFADAKKKDENEELNQLDNALSSADWLGKGTGDKEDLSQYTGGSFGGKEMSTDWD